MFPFHNIEPSQMIQDKEVKEFAYIILKYISCNNAILLNMIKSKSVIKQLTSMKLNVKEKTSY